jgi:PAS domain S-box-containing protein
VRDTKLQEDWHKTADIAARDHGKGDPFAAAVRWTRMPMVFADPRQVDTPLIYANNAFCELTGYSLDEIVGRNCRFLQGPDTDLATVKKISDAMAARKAIGVDILNYRKDGSSFWNGLYISPVVDEAGELLFFFASQLDVTARREKLAGVQSRRDELEEQVGARTRELENTLRSLEMALAEKTLLLHEVDHRVKNNLQTISTLISMQSRALNGSDPRPAFRVLQERVDALGAVHRRLNDGGMLGAFDLADLVQDLAPEILKAYSRNHVELTFDLERISLRNKLATPLGLIVNELITNAARHAWKNGEPGRLYVSSKRGDRHATLTVADDGAGMPAANGESRLSGLKLTEALVRQIRGTFVNAPAERGTVIQIGIPIHETER